MTDAVAIPTLRTERLTLRAPRLSDFDAFAAFRASDQMRLLGGPVDRIAAWHQFAGIAGQWVLRGYGRWMVTLDDDPIGVVGIVHFDEWPEPELGWALFEGFEGRGYAREAALAARRHAYDAWGWTTLVSLIGEANDRSRALARRLGCRPDGTFEHPSHGPLPIWRHPGPAEAAA